MSEKKIQPTKSTAQKGSFFFVQNIFSGFALLLIAFSPLFCIASVIGLVSTNINLSYYSCETPGTVTKVEERYSMTGQQETSSLFSKGSDDALPLFYATEVVYEVNGTEYTAEWASKTEQFSEGAQITVRYHEEDPSDFSLLPAPKQDQFRYTLGVILSCAGILLLILWIVRTIKKRREYRESLGLNIKNIDL